MNTENTNTDPGTEAISTSDIVGDNNQAGNDPFEKHLDMAIEAQDGKAATTDGEKQDDKQAGDKSKAADGKAGTGDGSDSAAQQQSDKDGKKKEGENRGPQDLVLKGQGPNGTDLVVKGGAERRFYEQARIAKDQLRVANDSLTAASTEINNLRTQLETVQRSVQAVNGLQPQQLGVAATIYSDLQRDPVGTLQKLLAEATAKGYKIEGIAAGVDAAAIERIIEARLGTQSTAQGPTDDEIVAEAEQVAAQFFGRFPDARQHETLLVKVMRDNPGVDLHTAYFGLREQFAERGFDWTRPLDEQLLERANANGGQQQQQQAQQQNNDNAQPGLPGSRPAHAGATEAGKAGSGGVAPDTMSMDEIIRQSMRDSGLNV